MAQPQGLLRAPPGVPCTRASLEPRLITTLLGVFRHNLAELNTGIAQPRPDLAQEPSQSQVAWCSMQRKGDSDLWKLVEDHRRMPQT